MRSTHDKSGAEGKGMTMSEMKTALDVWRTWEQVRLCVCVCVCVSVSVSVCACVSVSVSVSVSISVSVPV